MEDKSLFEVMVECVEPEQSFFQVFWTHANHMGEAIETVLSACSHLQIRNAIAYEADCVDPDDLSDEAIHDKNLNVFYNPGRIYFPTDESFIAPVGIIKSGEDGELDYTLIREGFSQTISDEGIYEVEVVVQREKLFDTFVELVRRLPSIKVFWIRLAPDWEDQNREEIWTNEELNSVELIDSYLKSHWNDTVLNGHVALTVYSTEGATNLSIDTHKLIKVLATSEKIPSEMAAALRTSGYEELQEFYSLEGGYYHWHYRPARSKSRSELVAAIKDDGFTLWKEEMVEPDE